MTRLEVKQAMAYLAHNFATLQPSLAVMVDSGFGKRKFVKNRVHILRPVYVAFVGSSTQPVPPISSRLVDNLAKPPDVTNNAVVLIVTPEFNSQHFVLFFQRQMAIASKPHPQNFQKPPQTLLPRLALDHPLAPA